MRVEGYSYTNIKGRGAYRLDLKARRGWMPKMKGLAARGSIVIRESDLPLVERGLVREQKDTIINFLSQMLSISHKLCRIIVVSNSQVKNMWADDYYFRGNSDTLIISARSLLTSLHTDGGRKLAAELLVPEMENLLAICDNIFVHKTHELALSQTDYERLDADIVTCRANIRLLKDGHPKQDMLIGETYKMIFGMWITLGKNL